MQPPLTQTLLLHDPRRCCWLRFERPLHWVEVSDRDLIEATIADLDDWVARGYYVAGWLGYEAAGAFDAALQTHSVGADALPLLGFGIFEAPTIVPTADLNLITELALELGPWSPTLTQAEFVAAIARIKAYIAAGDTFQVNYTFRLRSAFSGEAWALFSALMQAQPGNYSAFFEDDRFAICSASPELFFRQDGEVLTAKPMKGTIGRGRLLVDDELRALELRRSVKNQAENLMIVDMIRNDLGRVAEIGSVQVPILFETERYPTLWQMTSTVTARTQARMPEILRSLFPCASITGAPKASTMGIIRELESEPRQLYTGAIGYWGPGEALFNVAIRTVLVDKLKGVAEYGVGSGIVWDSDAVAEYEECCLKAEILRRGRSAFSLFETLLWTKAEGYFLLGLHLERLADSARYFDVPIAIDRIEEQLKTTAFEFKELAYRVRLVVDSLGRVTVEVYPWELLPVKPFLELAFADSVPVRLRFAVEAVESSNPFLYHKTTNRSVYDRAKLPDCDDVILWNERGEVTETTIANIVVRVGEKWVTPAVDCGLLPGTLRRSLLEAGVIEEGVVSCGELGAIGRCLVINSLRKWRWAIVVV
jgi:para-aminobenzoate synthetase / 4-amino-4-deoxychorismate lyase